VIYKGGGSGGETVELRAEASQGEKKEDRADASSKDFVGKAMYAEERSRRDALIRHHQAEGERGKKRVAGMGYEGERGKEGCGDGVKECGKEGEVVR